MTMTRDDDFGRASELLERCIDLIGLAKHCLIEGKDDDSRKAMEALRLLAFDPNIATGLESAKDDLARLGKVIPFFSRAGRTHFNSAHELAHFVCIALALFPPNSSAESDGDLLDEVDVSLVRAHLNRERVAALSKSELSAEWTEALTPSEWVKLLDMGLTTIKGHIKAGKLVVDKISTKKWRFRKDTIQRFTGQK